jgi:hypothetical protein
LDSGLYDGKVTGRKLFGGTQVPHGSGTIYYFQVVVDVIDVEYDFVAYVVDCVVVYFVVVVVNVVKVWG